MTDIGHPKPPSEVPVEAGKSFTGAPDVAQVQEDALVAEELATDE